MNLIDYTITFSIGSSLSKLGSSSKAEGISKGLGIAAGTIGLVSGGIGLSKMLKDGDKFTVVFMSAEGPKKLNIRAEDKIAAKHKIQSQTHGSDYKVFHNPQENDAALEYFESLESQSNN